MENNNNAIVVYDDKKDVKKRAALYIRVSTDRQAREGYSLEAQEHELRKWCERYGYDVVKIYKDEGISGKDLKHRPQATQLLADAEKETYDAVLVWALSRLTRSVSDLYHINSLLNRHNIGLVSMTETFDTTTPMGRAMMGMIGVFAQMEREITGERVLLAMEERARQGKRTAVYALGYDANGDSFIINAREAEYVRFCFEAYLKEKSLTIVAKKAIQKGYHGKRGKKPKPYSIQRIINNPIYLGYNMFKYQLYQGTHKPIIDEHLFYTAQKAMLENGKTVGRKRKAINTYFQIK